MSKRKRESAVVGSTQDLDECARMYVKNIFSNYMAKPGVKIKKNHYTPDPNKPGDVDVIDPMANRLTKIPTIDDLDEIVQKSFENEEQASSLFESVFEATKTPKENNTGKYRLNSNVVVPGAIVRVWNSLNQLDGNESHSVVTIDYNNRRVSFDTNNPGGVTVYLGDVKLPGVAHCIASPEASFVKKIARVYFDNKAYFSGKGPKASLARTIKLKGIGILTQENIDVLQRYLIDETVNMKHNYISEVYTRYRNTYFPIQPIYRISTSLYYEKYNNIVFNTSGRLKFTVNEEKQKIHKVKGSEMRPINCSSFMALLFPDIIHRTNTVSLRMLGAARYIPTTPSMLRPTYTYKCLDTIDNQITRVSWGQDKLAKVEAPGSVEYNILKTSGALAWGVKKFGSAGKFSAQLAVLIGTFIVIFLPFGLITAILGGAYLVIPLEFYDYFAGINPGDIFSSLKEIFSSVLCKGFGFVPKCDINTKSIPQLKEKYGDSQVDNFRKALEMSKKMKAGKKLAFKFDSTKTARRSRRRRSGRRRRPVRKSRRKSSKRQSRRRKSVRKSRKRQSRRRKSVRKSRKRRSRNHQRRRRKSVRKSRKRRSRRI